jgi:hypothetical protein
LNLRDDDTEDAILKELDIDVAAKPDEEEEEEASFRRLV